MKEPFERINTYAKDAGNGDTNIDIHAMAIDLITVAKMGGISLQDILQGIEGEWNNVQVELHIPATKVQ